MGSQNRNGTCYLLSPKPEWHLLSLVAKTGGGGGAKTGMAPAISWRQNRNGTCYLLSPKPEEEEPKPDGTCYLLAPKPAKTETATTHSR